MTEWINVPNDPDHVAREKQKARELRKSQWWRNKIAEGICFYCKKKFPPEQLTMDHVVPLARGGKSTPGNVVPCCKDCNNKKKYKTPVELLLEELKKDQNEK